MPPIAFGNDVVAIFNGDGDTTIVSLADWVSKGLLLSCTPTVNVVVAFAVGVPEIVPFEESVRPTGRVPAMIDQL